MKIQNFFDEAVAGRRLLTVTFAITIVYVALALTPSSYAIGLRSLGIPASPLLGTARGIRSDEYNVLTPLFQIALLGRFSPIDLISPYHESLKGFLALPIADWSLVFKPQLWAFWLMPPAYAYSIYFAILWNSFLIGYAILLRQLNAPAWMAAFGSLALYFSHFVQVWWTSNAPTFAFAPWPLIVFLLPLRLSAKAPLLFWVSSVWVFGLVYPAFILSGGFALGVLLIAFRRDAITVSNVAAAAIGIGGTIAAFFIYFGDLINIMQQTEYPGKRFASGGGVESSKILAHLFPYFTSLHFTPFLSDSNECEIAVVSTLLPLTVLVFGRHYSVFEYLRNNKINCLIVTVGLAMMLAWMTLPVPANFGWFLLWHEVPGNRMAWGFGLLLTLSLVLIASNVQFSISPGRFMLFFSALIAAWLTSKIGFTRIWSTANGSTLSALGRSWFDWFGIVPFGVAGLIAKRWPLISRFPAHVLFAAAVTTQLLTFGTFNPLQSARAIFAKLESPFLEKLREQIKSNPNGWAVVPGGFGAVLNGAGISAINHTLMAPQLEFFRRVFPDLPENEFNRAFNRYGHVIVEKGAKVHVSQVDMIIVPLEPFTKLVPPAPAKKTNLSKTRPNDLY